MDIIGTPREAQLDAEYEAFLKNGGGEQVWSMEIPPEMRAKKKSEGSPLFSAAPLGLLFADQQDNEQNQPKYNGVLGF
jgi:hypothetical protein